MTRERLLARGTPGFQRCASHKQRFVANQRHGVRVRKYWPPYHGKSLANIECKKAKDLLSIDEF
ncbi:hypothetical protein YSA_05325 [Pseudomonas putida ND6]|uniref:Uncharacterized protein n=1 Tax=Pseudomonas putida ND6 TaxID=231023 RepID=I3UVX2_PSEPU|nr:hypothetical protein YSA_05325 [Pseudomonas putida ND6]